MRQLICALCGKDLSSFPNYENIYLDSGCMELFCSQKCKKSWEKTKLANMMKAFKEKDDKEK